MSGERPRDRSEDGERLVDRRLQTPEIPPRTTPPIDPDDPVVSRLGRIAITEPGKPPPRTVPDEATARRLGELPVRETVHLDRTPPPDRQAPPEQRTRDDEAPREDRSR